MEHGATATHSGGTLHVCNYNVHCTATAYFASCAQAARISTATTQLRLS